MGWLVRWSLRFRLLVLALAAGIVGFGLINAPEMSVDNLPEFAPPHVQIQTEALGLSAVEVEQLITSPMEADLLNGVAWLDEIRSVSVPGLSSIDLIFEPGTNVLRARQLVAERLTQAFALPNVSTPPVLMQPLSSTSRVMMIKLSSQDVSLMDMSVLARWNVKPKLMGVPGVANVSIWGQREQQLQVQVDPDQLRAKGVTLEQVIETTGNAVWVSPLSFLEASTPGTGGFLESANQRIGIQHVLPIQTPEDLGKVTVEGTESGRLLLRDVAELSEDHQPLIGDAVTGDEPGLLLVIEKFPDTSVEEVTGDIEDALDDLKPGLTGITVDSTVFRPASFLAGAVDDLGLALLVSLLVVTLAIGLAFRSWRYALVGLVGIGLSATAAAVLLELQGAVFNTMVFAGLVLALAVIVGDVITDLHSVRLRTDADGAEPQEGRLVRALKRSRIPAVFAALMSALAVAPALFVPGIDGEFLRPLVLAYLLALLVAAIVALTVTPALAGILLAGDRSPRPDPAFLRRLRARGNSAGERLASGRQWVAAAVVAAIAIAGVAAIPFLADGKPIVAEVPDRTILIQWEAAAGTAGSELSRVMAIAGTELRSVPGVDSVGGHVGRAITSDTASDVSSAELWVTMTPEADFRGVRAAVEDIVIGYPGIATEVITYPERQIAAVRDAGEQPFQVRVYGIDLDVMREKAEEVRQILAETDGVVNPRVDVTIDQPIAEIEVNLAAAEKHGIKPGDVRRAAAAILQGIEVGYLFEQQKVFQVVVKGNAEVRNSLTSVRELVINTPDGGHVQLGQVAEVRVSPNQTVINHDDTSRRIDVSAEIEGRSLADVTTDIQAAIAKMEFPVEHHAAIPPQYEEQQASGQLVWWLLAAAVIGILILLQTVLGSWKLAGLAFVLLPVALFGGLLAAVLAEGIGSLYALIGFAAVLAIAVRDVILLLGRYQTLQGRDPSASPESLVRAAYRDRLAPTILAGLTTAVALIPLVLLGGAVGVTTILPLAVIVWGGLATSALLTLLILPILLVRFGPARQVEWESSLVSSDGPVPQERQDVS
ncbi:efflux RND transporter permease subunit [Cryobacterium sp. TMT1-2-1]|uniref:efflux RND transporter permease subunit n=1 Tax=Cryobacterium sp. TMT1-2-1 TaxID=1259232 RepID=UPI00106DAF37|nr:efflux RND transporter permease subunit [Cryobacterium sp. TMT1-2-1]TFD45741.1 efflux RND transporter permease subunit [Cryobacterium sp. TMT1-2-1]